MTRSVLTTGIFTAIVLLGVAITDRPAGAQDAQIAQAGRPVRGPILPFEADFAQRRKDKALLQFNDHIASIPGTRIRDVPTVNGRMGDRVIVVEGTGLHFPVGYLMTATYQFDKQRARGGASSVAAATDLEPNPDYALVKRFDSELGPVCAVTEDKTSKQRLEFRIKPGTKQMTLVLDQPGRYDGISKDTSRSFALFVGVEERYLINDAISKKLLTHCKSGAKDVTVTYDGALISLAAMTGTDGSKPAAQ
jgi:hypothetical protein